MRQKGFTLIELMIAVSITAILGALSIAGFANYNQTQVLQTSANEVTTMLNLAKSRSQSQIKSSELCPSNNTLDGYAVRIVPDASYTLYLRCSGLDVKIKEQDRSLPSGLRFTSGISFFFPVHTSGAQTPGQIVIANSSGKTKTIVVNAL